MVLSVFFESKKNSTTNIRTKHVLGVFHILYRLVVSYFRLGNNAMLNTMEKHRMCTFSYSTGCGGAKAHLFHECSMIFETYTYIYSFVILKISFQFIECALDLVVFVCARVCVCAVL